MCSAEPSTSQLSIKINEFSAKPDVRQVIAFAVINRLHEWCVQLFWITLMCVVGCCEPNEKSEQSDKRRSNDMSPRRQRLQDIEMKMIRHLTSPFLASRQRRPSKRRPASRPPSPQLFDIAEEPLEC